MIGITLSVMGPRATTRRKVVVDTGYARDLFAPADAISRLGIDLREPGAFPYDAIGRAIHGWAGDAIVLIPQLGIEVGVTVFCPKSAAGGWLVGCDFLAAVGAEMTIAGETHQFIATRRNRHRAYEPRCPAWELDWSNVQVPIGIPRGRPGDIEHMQMLFEHDDGRTS